MEISAFSHRPSPLDPRSPCIPAAEASLLLPRSETVPDKRAASRGAFTILLASYAGKERLIPTAAESKNLPHVPAPLPMIKALPWQKAAGLRREVGVVEGIPAARRTRMSRRKSERRWRPMPPNRRCPCATVVDDMPSRRLFFMDGNFLESTAAALHVWSR